MQQTSEDTVVIGYFSGWPKTHEEDFAVALPSVIRVLNDFPHTRLRIVGHLDLASFPTSLQKRVEVAPFVPWEDLFASIAKIDINLAPIIDNPHRRSKSAVKFLEAALVGVPTIASDLEPYSSIANYESGIRAATDDEWYLALSHLVRDSTLRREMGCTAHDQVLAQDASAARSEHFMALIRELATSNQLVPSGSIPDSIATTALEDAHTHAEEHISMPQTPFVSIIVRARNEEAALRRLIPLLLSQRANFPFEIILLDNDSQDGTAALAKEYDLHYHLIPRNKFNYSTALNTGAELARGEILVNLSAHCFPQGDYWLAHLIEPFHTHLSVIASYGRQWTNPWTNPFESLGNDSLFPPPGTQPQVVAFSNANCAVRRDFVLMHQFNPVIKILEDHLFYLELSSEYRFVYAPEALVNHEHDEFSWRYYMRRWLREGWASFFLTEHRGLKSPFVNRPFLRPKNLLYYYPRLAAWFARNGRRRVGVLTLPFFYLRDTMWLVGFQWGRLRHARMAQQDTALLLKMEQHMVRQVVGQRHISPNMNDSTSYPVETV